MHYDAKRRTDLAPGNILQYAAGMKTREIIRMVEADGWVIVAQKGSHRQYKHPTKPGRVTIAVHGLNDDVKLGTLYSILRQAGLK